MSLKYIAGVMFLYTILYFALKDKRAGVVYYFFIISTIKKSEGFLPFAFLFKFYLI
jgi:hypothetical protein